MDSVNTRVIKVVLLGDAAVGKTSLRSQFIKHVFSSAYKTTLGGDYLTSRVNLPDNSQVSLQIWDTAGQERFNSISQAFYRGTDIAIIIYDITNAESFHHLSRWLGLFLDHCNVSNPSIMIVGNKVDKDTIRQISLRQAREFANMMNPGLIQDVELDVLETSAKVFGETSKLFVRAAELGLKKLEENQPVLNFDSIDVAHPIENRAEYRCC
ncbi:unnamed protein product [Kuraishia capsulata CBS 1993]|uniref:Uncharacterized protein n=1 Tax=Kuraishia capsulata CBS 1993 TaxID=1382522 RepID=W6MNF7_9ASCO|nr:uncharacterized protein KUCA_T00003792001 [Kuraishia capsulata CBS 1993]CDK27813.1 unnamed protein product [Kuraishia capsulata CBS 1993]